MEVIVVATSAKAPLVDTGDLESFAAWQVVTIPEMHTGAAGWAAGIPRARSPLVVLCEDHSFPDPEWAAALIAAHRQDYAAVGPVMRNANPETLVSWANFLLCFCEYYSIDRSQAVSSCPGHNTCYRRDVLLDYSDLENWLTSERVLHLDMEAKGHKLMLDPAAATNHVNMSLPRSYLKHSLLGGRVFGALRASQWSTVQAWLHALAFPLVPPIRLWRLLKLLNTPAKRRESRFWKALPWIMAGLLMHAVGEAVGYITGEGDSVDTYNSFEMYRREHLNAADRAMLSA